MHYICLVRSFYSESVFLCRRSRSSDQSFSTNATGPPPPPELPANEKAPWVNIPTSAFASDWSKLVNNSSHSDVVFKLGSKLYYAHRYVLTSASDMFRQLFGVTEKVKVYQQHCMLETVVVL